MSHLYPREDTARQIRGKRFYLCLRRFIYGAGSITKPYRKYYDGLVNRLGI
jgi:hypothetical protein